MKKDLYSIIALTMLLIPTIDILIAAINSDSQMSDYIKNEINNKELIWYGLSIDSFYIEQGKIANDQTFSMLLQEYNVPYSTVLQLVDKAEGVVNLKKLRKGKPFKAFCRNDSTKELQYLIYENSPEEYIKFQLSDSIIVTEEKRPVIIKEKSASGQISTSLWNTMKANNLDPELANKLSEIYAWSIDFFGLQKGDEFRIIYEEKWTDDLDKKCIGLGTIKAAIFYHAGKEFSAVMFEQDSTLSYFDYEGNSLQKAYLKAPLKFSRISSGFSYSRLHPVLKVYRPHLGIDYAAPVGTPVHAIGDGVVVQATNVGAAGNMIKIKHNSSHASGYLHLSRFAKGVNVGTYVKQGDVIGYVGSTGRSTGPHLDFRFWKNGKNINPSEIEAPPVEPVKEANRQVFDELKIYYQNRFNELFPSKYQPLA